jgi:hypothetical protein|tara:strand:- start:173 stop:388 length:216 start_codon:yes stop_codon:yes gene_type:complete
MPYITTIKTIERTTQYWVPQEIIDKSYTNCGDSAYSYLAAAHDTKKPDYLDEQEIDERIILPVFPKTQVSD